MSEQSEYIYTGAALAVVSMYSFRTPTLKP